MAGKVPEGVESDFPPDFKMISARKVVSSMKSNITGVLASEIRRLLDVARTQNLIGEVFVENSVTKTDREAATEFLDNCMSLFLVDSSKFDVMLEVIRSSDYCRVVADKIEENFQIEMQKAQKNSHSYPGTVNEATSRSGLPAGSSFDSATEGADITTMQSYEEIETMIKSEQNKAESKVKKNQSAIRLMKEHPQEMDSAEDLSSQAQDNSDLYQKYFDDLKKKETNMEKLKDEHQEKISKLKEKVKGKELKNDELKTANREYEESVKNLGIEILELKKNIQEKDSTMLHWKIENADKVHRLKIEISELKAAHEREISTLKEAHTRDVSGLKEEILMLKQKETDRLVEEYEREKQEAAKKILELQEELERAKVKKQENDGRSDETGQPSQL